MTVVAPTSSLHLDRLEPRSTYELALVVYDSRGNESAVLTGVTGTSGDPAPKVMPAPAPGSSSGSSSSGGCFIGSLGLSD